MGQDWMTAALLAWQVWLIEQQERLDPEAWEALRAEAERVRLRVVFALDGGRAQEAEGALTAFAMTHHISAIRHMRRVEADRDDDVFRGGGEPPKFGVPRRPVTDTRAPGTLLQGLGRLLGLRPPLAPIVTFPEVRLPTEVREHTSFHVEVTARAAPTPHTGGAIELERPPSGRVDLDVSIELPDAGIEARSPLDQPLRVHEDGTSVTLVFELFAAVPGAPRVNVIVRKEGLELSRISRHVTILPQDHPAADVASAPVSVPFGGVSAVEFLRGVRLRIDARGETADRRIVRVVLDGGRWTGAPLEHQAELQKEAWRTIADLCRKLAALKVDSREAAEMRFENIGADLAGKLLGPAISAALATFPDGTALHIESDDAWVPWEMVFVQPANGVGAEGYLGERFAVTRWLRVGRLRESVSLTRGVLVAPRGSGLQFAGEQRALRVLFGTPPEELFELDDVQRRLRSAPQTLIHLVCHGASWPDATFAEDLVMDGGSLATSDIRMPAPGEPGVLDGSFVFANACEAGIAAPSLWAVGGWAERVLGAGAVAFVAPSWSVRDRSAVAFAEKFYEHVTAGATLGEAARLARVASRRTGVPCRLGYAVYAAPGARMGMSSGSGSAP